MDYTEIEKAISECDDAIADRSALMKNLNENVLVSNTSDFSSLTTKLDNIGTTLDTDTTSIDNAVTAMKKIEENVRNGVV